MCDKMKAAATAPDEPVQVALNDDLRGDLTLRNEHDAVLVGTFKLDLVR